MYSEILIKIIALLSGFDNVFSDGEKAVFRPFSGGGQGTVNGGTVDGVESR